MTDTFIDGCGVHPDRPLPAGVRIRFRLHPDNPDGDVTVHVANGRLHVDGFRHRVAVDPVSPARVAVRTVAT